MPNINTTELREDGQLQRRLGELAGAEHLGLTVYELAPGQAMHFHYHLQREELLVVLDGTLAVRTAEGWSEVAAEGGRCLPPRGARCARLREPRRYARTAADDQRAERA